MDTSVPAQKTRIRKFLTKHEDALLLAATIGSGVIVGLGVGYMIGGSSMLKLIQADPEGYIQ